MSRKLSIQSKPDVDFEKKIIELLCDPKSKTQIAIELHGTTPIKATEELLTHWYQDLFALIDLWNEELQKGTTDRHPYDRQTILLPKALVKYPFLGHVIEMANVSAAHFGNHGPGIMKDVVTWALANLEILEEKERSK